MIDNLNYTDETITTTLLQSFDDDRRINHYKKRLHNKTHYICMCLLVNQLNLHLLICKYYLPYYIIYFTISTDNGVNIKNSSQTFLSNLA